MKSTLLCFAFLSLPLIPVAPVVAASPDPAVGCIQRTMKMLEHGTVRLAFTTGHHRTA